MHGGIDTLPVCDAKFSFFQWPVCDGLFAADYFIRDDFTVYPILTIRIPSEYVRIGLFLFCLTPTTQKSRT